MVKIDYFRLPKLYLHSAMYSSVPKSKKMCYIFATPGDLWLIRGFNLRGRGANFGGL